ncbi:hypothetical protein [Microbulbifer sp. TYP-18]|uniref:hypothetical protein n=1 Tax=Microbulbifer sp. TYP-18 TaxID=3230024 RepID=UPI0034C6034E
MLSKAGTLIAATAALLLAAGAQAETIEVPVGAQGDDIPVEQLRGLNKHQVNARLGEPVTIQGPIGEPAITRWEYADFYVYFERDMALHTVKKHRG